MDNERPKEPLTIRVEMKTLAELKSRAEAEGKTVSSVANQAIEAFLKGGDSIQIGEQFVFGDDLRKAASVLDSLGKSAPLSFVGDVIQLLHI